ncbi:hypothetical protein Tsubulata_028406 [Turnera subulata]|uniref:Cation/H+ exchanger domain-containing protein n=1 Tax=Turnera subulata TaxID=218843 RepID=A0A9Q0FHB4_9ROSI|nr:hypothetical protein Tsubulata_028406 [Turnera subulata]
MEFRRGQDITKFTFLPVMLQIALLNIFRLTFQLILKPLGQPSFVPEILGGIVVCSPLLGKEFHEKILFGGRTILVTSVLEECGIMFLLFLLSVRLDMSIVKKCGGLAVVIGITTFVVPEALTLLISLFVREIIPLDNDLHLSLPVVSGHISSTSFHVISALLADLKLLNSELGRLALSSSMISGLFCWGIFVICNNLREVSRMETTLRDILLTQVWKIVIILFVVFTLRPVMFWMVKQTPDGKPLKESHVYWIIVMVLVCGLVGEFTGQHLYFGPVVLGLAAPPGPELASTLIEKIDCFLEAVLIPCYLINTGRVFNLHAMKIDHFVAVELLFFAAVLSKLTSIIVVSLYYRVPFMDSLTLGLIYNVKGFMDIQSFLHALQSKVISTEVFSILVLTSTVHSAIFTPLVRCIYSPSRRYVAYRRHTIQHSEPFSELRILACIHKQDDVHSIINILNATNPSRESPIAVYVLNLKESVAGTLPFFITHKLRRTSATKTKETDRIINAFFQFEQQNYSLLSVQCFTSIGVYQTMHDDICTMALEKMTSLVLIPFHILDSSSVRMVNKKVLEYASCSVGILIARGKLSRYIVPYQLKMNVCVVFIGGPDDREALAYGARMSALPGIKLTVLRLTPQEQGSYDFVETRRDLTMLNSFKYDNLESNIEYWDESISCGEGTAKLLGSMCNNFDLIMVGRRHDPHSPILMGLSEWSEIQELGVVGDLLAAPDMNYESSVLVIQQQASVVEEMIH